MANWCTSALLLAPQSRVDSGSGRVGGGSVFGPAESARIVRDLFGPFEDLGMAGATSTKSRATGRTDSTSYNAAGLPASA